MTTGLIEGWQHFSDDLRIDNPLLPVATWVSALHDAGFYDAAAWPKSGSPAGCFGQHVFVARVPGTLDMSESCVPPHADWVDPSKDETTTIEHTENWRQKILDALPTERTTLMRNFVREKVMQVLRLSVDDPPGRNDRLMDLGFDSLMAVQLRNVLASALVLDCPLPATLIFDHPTIDAIGAYLVTQLVPADVENLHSTTAMFTGAAQIGEAAVAAMSDSEIEELLLRRLDSR